MKLAVKTETLNAAGKCKHNHVCQTDGGLPHCAINETVNGKVFFTKDRETTGCPYQHSFGSAFMCMCPVRQEIYRKYKI
ncbi:hypothetical protein [Pontiella sulfatireligans]|uniref:Uncharacterized protein n=1 Tax=Pontiella sulfatireligans TaxID=2750658 RepID=A0A6C2USZ4_9BACT|nr:hypothetical protein [Pontiella sulfatireligans]VGO22364.1 hypothetical protein SCARR_04447 [Pontiella sulfatireligans]